MSAETFLTGPEDVGLLAATPDGPFPSTDETVLTLGSLPLGARLVLRCRKDWRTAAVAAFEHDLERVVLTVASPSGHNYRVRRPADSPLAFDGAIPILSDRGPDVWRVSLARYDARW